MGKYQIQVNWAQFNGLLENAAFSTLLDLADDFKGVRWWWVDKNKMIYDASTGILWDANPDMVKSYQSSNQQEARVACEQKKTSDQNWAVPTEAEFYAMAKTRDFPIYAKYLDKSSIFTTSWWLSTSGLVLVNVNNNKSTSTGSGFLIARNKSLIGKILSEFLVSCIERKWSVKPHGVSPDKAKKFQADFCSGLVDAYLLNQPSLLSVDTIKSLYQDIDYNSVRLPKLDALRFTDVHQGLWEFYAAEGIKQRKTHRTLSFDEQLRARNPELDIKEGNVAIDFGTSSTVVAFKEQGNDALLRIGLSDFNQAPESKHFENPTVLEFLDFAQFSQAWTAQAYRPQIIWDSIRCSHVARARLRENDSDIKVVGSVLERLKQWALRGSEHALISITDQDYGAEYTLPPLQKRDPVKGQPLTVNAEYAFDPIELYAWFLGMNINWRQRGIFLKYYMTFPVKYSSEIKAKILSSFRRGLQRSLPESLLTSQQFTNFSVEERGSEPAAFAAGALQAYDIEPTEAGVAYAVFDFGGGTTDFDYGYYRLPTDQEQDSGSEHVLEHFSAEGDEFLGGENLLENMAYRLFCNNLDVCRSKQIAFTRPLDALDFVGSELLIGRTQAAINNTTMLMAKLRPLWEQGRKNANSAGTLKIKLIDRQGVQVDCDLKLDEADLIQYLKDRIRLGLDNFFTAMKLAFTGRQASTMPDTVHILLAGNASHSKIIQDMLIEPKQEATDPVTEKLLSDQATAKSPYQQTLAGLGKIFGHDCPKFEVHLPLPSDPKRPQQPNAKTGVALGLLHLCPGETLHVINHATQNNSESPFQFYVGSYVLNKFKVVIKRGDEYGGDWKPLGKVRERVFILAYSQAANTVSGETKRGDLQLTEKRLEFASAEVGDQVFARAKSPHEIEICVASDINQAAVSPKQKQTLKLEPKRS